MTKKILTLLLLVVATLSVSAKDIREYVVTTFPQMTCQNCENKIKKNLRFEKGVTNIKTDLANQLVTVSYDAEKTNEANIEAAFSKLQYKVVPATKENVSEVRAKAEGKAGHACKAGGCKGGACKDGACKKDHKCKKEDTCKKDGASECCKNKK